MIRNRGTLGKPRRRAGWNASEKMQRTGKLSVWAGKPAALPESCNGCQSVDERTVLHYERFVQNIPPILNAERDPQPLIVAVADQMRGG